VSASCVQCDGREHFSALDLRSRLHCEHQARSAGRALLLARKSSRRRAGGWSGVVRDTGSEASVMVRVSVASCDGFLRHHNSRLQCD